MKKSEVAQCIVDGVGQLNYEYLAEHDGAEQIFPIIELTADKKGVVLVTEGNQRFEVVIRNEDDE